MLDPLTFAELRVADVERCDAAVWGPGNALHDWSPTDWACALAGEVGEACNLIKKARRDGRGYDLGRVLNIAKELADVVVYADLLAARLGIDLGAAVREKFNEVSKRVGSSVTLSKPNQLTTLTSGNSIPGVEEALRAEAVRAARVAAIHLGLYGGRSDPNRCVCAEQERGPFADTPHVHYSETPPYACARCDCAAYSPAVPAPLVHRKVGPDTEWDTSCGGRDGKGTTYLTENELLVTCTACIRGERKESA